MKGDTNVENGVVWSSQVTQDYWKLEIALFDRALRVPISVP